MNKSVSFQVPVLIRLLQCSKLSSDKHETRKMSRFWKVRVVAGGMNIIFLKGSSPAYSAKQMVSGDLRIFSSKRSFLLRKRMMEVSPNHLLLQIESNSFKLSCIRFWTNIKVNILQFNNNVHPTVVSSSCSTWSYSDMATQKMMAVTSSKQWIHFFLSDLWPPTSNNL